MSNFPYLSLKIFGVLTVQQKTALFRKLKSLEDVKPGKLAGKMGVVINLVTRLPVAIWIRSNPRTSDTRFEDNLLELVPPQTLLLLDRGFYHFQFWQKLIQGRVHFITPIKINASIKYQQVFTDSYSLRDCAPRTERSSIAWLKSARERKKLP